MKPGFKLESAPVPMADTSADPICYCPECGARLRLKAPAAAAVDKAADKQMRSTLVDWVPGAVTPQKPAAERDDDDEPTQVVRSAFDASMQGMAKLIDATKQAQKPPAPVRQTTPSEDEEDNTVRRPGLDEMEQDADEVTPATPANSFSRPSRPMPIATPVATSVNPFSRPSQPMPVAALLATPNPFAGANQAAAAAAANPFSRPSQPMPAATPIATPNPFSRPSQPMPAATPIATPNPFAGASQAAAATQLVHQSAVVTESPVAPTTHPAPVPNQAPAAQLAHPAPLENPALAAAQQPLSSLPPTTIERRDTDLALQYPLTAPKRRGTVVFPILGLGLGIAVAAGLAFLVYGNTTSRGRGKPVAALEANEVRPSVAPATQILSVQAMPSASAPSAAALGEAALGEAAAAATGSAESQVAQQDAKREVKVAEPTPPRARTEASQPRASSKASVDSESASAESKSEAPDTERHASTPKSAKAKSEDEGEADGPAFDSEAATAALESAAQRASTCRQPSDPSGVARVTVTFAPSGRVTTANLAGPPFTGTPTGSCIATIMRSASVPAFSGSSITVRKTVTIL